MLKENEINKDTTFKPNINGSLEQKRHEAQKRKDLPNGLVFARVKGVTEMHSLDKVELHIENVFDGTVGDFIKMVAKDIKDKNITLKLQKEAILSNDKRLKYLEKVVKDYGLE